jgi:hypothetical protein
MHPGRTVKPFLRFIHAITAGTAVTDAQTPFTEMKTETDIRSPGAREQRQLKACRRQTDLHGDDDEGQNVENLLNLRQLGGGR